MKHTNLILLVVGLLFSCENHESSGLKTIKPKKEERLIEVKNGFYREWYPGKKQVKFEGELDESKKRKGLWRFYSEKGTELSTTYYEHGLKEGFSIVKYPNGALHYRGEYHKDKTVGVWTIYDEKGNVLSETDFGHPEEK